MKGYQFWKDNNEVEVAHLPGQADPFAEARRLASLKAAIGNFVKIVTGKEISIEFSTGSESYTDGTSVVIGADFSERNMDANVGLALHEGSHCILTDFQLLKDLPRQVSNYYQIPQEHNIVSRIKTIFNIIEDRRIDHYIYSSASGYKDYYLAMYDKYFNADCISTVLKAGMPNIADWDSYEFHLINLTNPHRKVTALPKLWEIWDLIDLANIGRLKNSADALSLSFRIADLIIESVGMTTSAASNRKVGKLIKDTGQKSFTLSKALNEVDTALDKQKSFIDGTVAKKRCSKQNNHMSTALCNNSLASAEVDMGSRVIIARGLHPSITSTVCQAAYVVKPETPKYVTKGVQHGKRLAKLLLTRNESRTLVTSRQRVGRIDGRLLAEAGFGYGNIFQQTKTEQSAPVFLHLSLDASGSMTNDNNWEKTIFVATAIAIAARVVTGMHCIISLRATTNSDNLLWIVYDSKINSERQLIQAMSNTKPVGGTPESLCYEAIFDEIIKAAAGHDAVFITFSDGEPSWGKNQAATHCVNQMKKLTSAGIATKAYFIGDESSRQYSNYFKSAYGNAAELINTGSLPALAKSINSLFIKK
jgi:hypothetical protein